MQHYSSHFTDCYGWSDHGPVKIPVRNFAMVPTKCPNMFSGRVEALAFPEFRNKFPNLYIKPMQYDNSEGKWQDVIPYMIINLDYDRPIYISKDTVISYAKEEDATCEYLEVNEVIESTEFQNWPPRPRPKIVDSDWYFLQPRSQNTIMWSWRINTFHRKLRTDLRN